MKFKLAELKSTMEGLQELLEKEIPSKPSYWLGKCLNKIMAEMKDFEDARMRLINKWAVTDIETGKPVINKETNRYEITNEPEFEKEFTLLAEEEIEVDINPIKLEALGDKFSVKPLILLKLGKIIEE